MSGEIENIIINTEKVVEVSSQTQQQVAESEQSLEQNKNYLEQIKYQIQLIEQDTNTLEVEIEVNNHFKTELDDKHKILRKQAETIYQIGQEVYQDISLCENEEPLVEDLVEQCQQYSLQLEEKYKKKLANLNQIKTDKHKADQLKIEKTLKQKEILKENNELLKKFNDISLEYHKLQVIDEQKSKDFDIFLQEFKAIEKENVECEVKIKFCNEEKGNISTEMDQNNDNHKNATDQLNFDIDDLNTQIGEEEDKLLNYKTNLNQIEERREMFIQNKHKIQESIQTLLESIKKIEANLQEINDNSIAKEKQIEIDKLTKTINKQEHVLTTKLEEISKLNKDVQELQADEQGLGNENVTLTQVLNEMESSRPQVNEEIELLKEKTVTTLKETEELQQKISKSQTDIEEKHKLFELEQNEKNNELKELQTKFKEVESEFEAKLKQAEANVTKIELENNKMQLQNNNNQQLLEDLKKKLSETKTINTKLTEETKISDIKLQNLNSEIKVLKSEKEKNVNLVPIISPRSFKGSQPIHKIKKQNNLLDQMSDTSNEGEIMDHFESLKRKKINQLRSNKKSKKIN